MENNSIEERIIEAENQRAGRKTASLTMRLTAETRSEIITRADALGLNQADYIEHLLYQDNARELKNLNLLKKVERLEAEKAELENKCGNLETEKAEQENLKQETLTSIENLENELSQSNEKLDLYENNQDLADLFNLFQEDEMIKSYDVNGEIVEGHPETKEELFALLIADYKFKIMED